MQKLRLLTKYLIIILTVSLILQYTPIRSYSEPSETPYDHIILIALDGINPSILSQAPTPNMDALMSNGSYSFNACSVTPYNTISAIPAILTGAHPEVHQLTSWDAELKAESLIEVFEEAGYSCAIIGESANLGGNAASYCTGFINRADFDDHYFQVALEWLTEYDPFFMFIYDPMPDRAGHQYGHESSEYRKAIENADYHIGRLVEMLRILSALDDTLIVITTDHGLTSKSHTQEAFSIWSSPNVKSGHEMTETRYVAGYGLVSHQITDIAPTILELMELRPLLDATGTVISSIIDTEPLVSFDVSLSLEPKVAYAPLREGDRETLLVAVDVFISEVENLKSFQLKADYSQALLELWDTRISPQVKAQTGGSQRVESVWTFPKAFSGSGVLLSYYFKPKALGPSSFSLYDIELFDSSGVSLSYEVNSCEIRVIPFNEWIDGMYEELFEEYTLLGVRYGELNETYYDALEAQATLLSVLSGLEEDLQSLQGNIASLEVENQNLSDNVDNLQSQLKAKDDMIRGILLASIIGLLIIIIILVLRAKK